LSCAHGSPSKVGATVTLTTFNARHQLVKLATTKVVRGRRSRSGEAGIGTWHLTVVIRATPGNIAGRSGVLTVKHLTRDRPPQQAHRGGARRASSGAVSG